MVPAFGTAWAAPARRPASEDGRCSLGYIEAQAKPATKLVTSRRSRTRRLHEICGLGLAGLLLLLPLGGAGAQEQPSTQVLDSVVVTATRDASRDSVGDVDLELTPAFYSLIPRTRFEGRMESLAEVIAKEMGAQVRSTGGLGGFATLSLRGSTSEQVMVYLDGILLNDGSGGGVNLANFSLADVDSIEIFRGATPAGFGKASLGGVVNIRTLSHQPGLHYTLGGGGGSFNTQGGSVLLNHGLGEAGYLLAADWLSSDNDFSFVNDGGTEHNRADDREETRRGAWFRQGNLLAKGQWELSPDWRLDFLNQYFDKTQGLANLHNTPSAASLNTQRDLATLRLSRRGWGPLGLNTALRLDYTHKDETYDDRRGHVGLDRQKYLYATRRYGANLLAEWPAAWHMATLSCDLRHEDYETRDLFKGHTLSPSQRDYLSVAGQDSLFFWGQRLILTPGLRYTLVQDELESGQDTFGHATDPRSRDEDYFSPQVGLKFLILPWLSLKGNLARYVREPSFYELYGDRGHFLGNDELRAEEGTNYDLGLEATWRGRQGWLTRLGGRAVWFRSEVDDLITPVYDARGIGRSENISGALIQGLELGLNAELLEMLRLSLNGTWQSTENQSQVRAFAGKELPGRFARTLNARVEFLWGRALLYGEYCLAEDMFYDTANLLPAATKREFNLGLALAWGDWRVEVEGRNLSDEEYEDFNGYPLPGRAFYLTLRYGR